MLRCNWLVFNGSAAHFDPRCFGKFVVILWRQRITTKSPALTPQFQENRTDPSPSAYTGSLSTLISTSRMIHTTRNQILKCLYEHAKRLVTKPYYLQGEKTCYLFSFQMVILFLSCRKLPRSENRTPVLSPRPSSNPLRYFKTYVKGLSRRTTSPLPTTRRARCFQVVKDCQPYSPEISVTGLVD